ncbi:MAG: beta-propeller domain-containing protein [Cellvibrionaceae bacterium]|nr:beta-propeller domain-containing protein [Cellvibrionaceae bacterium]
MLSFSIRKPTRIISLAVALALYSVSSSGGLNLPNTPSASKDAATIYEDLPLFQSGLWWSQRHNGHGLDIQFAEDIVFIVLYTYSRDRKPIWYTAQAELVDGKYDTDLLLHSWNTETQKYEGFVKDGKISLEVNNPTSISANIEVQGGSTALELEPFAQSNVSAEEPKTGLWFNPQNSGYGFTYVEQQRWQFGLYYYYDEAGAPTWLYGSNGGVKPDIELLKFDGRCFSCAGTAPTGTKAGSANFSFSQQKRGQVSIQLEQESPWALNKSPIHMLSEAESERPSFFKLSRFNESEGLAQYLRDGYASLRPRIHADFSPAPPASNTSSAVSSTNLQEQGVDEIDFIKTDQHCAFTFPSDKDNSIASYSLNSDGGITSKEWFTKTPFQASSDGETISNLNDFGLYLSDSHVATVSSSYLRHYGDAWQQDEVWQGGHSYVDVYVRNECSLNDPQRIALSGYAINSRRIDDNLYVLWRSVTNVKSSWDQEQNQQLQAALAELSLAELVPQVRPAEGEWQAALNKDNTYVLAGKQFPATNFMMLTRISLSDPNNIKTIALAGHLETVYMSANAAYLVTSADSYRSGAPNSFSSYSYSTQIHKVNLDQELSYAGSGSVDGYLDEHSDLASFRLSENKGDLAVVTQFTELGVSRYKLSILTPSEKREGFLTYKSYLPNLANPEPLGKANERLEATRFVGNKMYAVTFERIDPLYVVNLEDHEAPFIEGVLEVPGFSEYLHPLPNDKLLGVGRAADAFGQETGNQLSLFDISNAKQPILLKSLEVGGKGSTNAVSKSHHAFSMLEKSAQRPARFAIPMVLTRGVLRQASGLVEFEFNDDYSDFDKVSELITYEGEFGNSTSSNKFSAALRGRSTLFENRVLYYEGGRLWGADWGDNIPDYVPEGN